MIEGTIWGDDALDTREAAELCNMGYQYFTQRYKEWKVPHHRIAGRPVFVKPDLEKWVAGRVRRDGRPWAA